MRMRERVTCGLCGGSHRAGLSKCPFCGNHGEVEVRQPKVEVPRQAAEPESSVYHWLMLASVAGFVTLLLLYIAPMHPLHGPGVRALKLIVGASLLIAVLGIKDAQFLQRNYKQAGVRPEVWFVRFLIGWPLTLPRYLALRGSVTGAAHGKAVSVLVYATGVLAVAVILLAFQKEESYRPAALQNREAPVVHDHWPPHHGASGGAHTHQGGELHHDHQHQM